MLGFGIHGLGFQISALYGLGFPIQASRLLARGLRVGRHYWDRLLLKNYVDGFVPLFWDMLCRDMVQNACFPP